MRDKEIFVDYDFQGTSRIKRLPVPSDPLDAARKQDIDDVEGKIDDVTGDGITLNLNGDYTAGQCILKKTGDFVLLSLSATQHNNGTFPKTSTGFLPVEYRPTTRTIIQSVYYEPSNIFCVFEVSPSGSLECKYNSNIFGGDSTRNNFPRPLTGMYNINN